MTGDEERERAVLQWEKQKRKGCECVDLCRVRGEKQAHQSFPAARWQTHTDGKVTTLWLSPFVFFLSSLPSLSTTFSNALVLWLSLFFHLSHFPCGHLMRRATPSDQPRRQRRPSILIPAHAGNVWRIIWEKKRKKNWIHLTKIATSLAAGVFTRHMCRWTAGAPNCLSEACVAECRSSINWSRSCAALFFFSVSTLNPVIFT